MTTTLIKVADYNLIQQKVNSVLGTNPLGYGQLISSSLLNTTPPLIISVQQWLNLRSDLLRCRWHQSGVEDDGELPAFPHETVITMADKTLYVNMANTIYTNRLAPLPLSQSASPTIAAFSYTPIWNNTLELNITVSFVPSANMLYYFNTSSELLFDFDITLIPSEIGKTLLWKAFLQSLGTVRMDHSTTLCNLYQTNIGFRQLTTAETLICALSMDTIPGNSFKMYARLGEGASPTELFFRILFSDANTENGDENIGGILTSTVTAYHAAGNNVVVRPPTATGQYSGGVAVTYAIGQNKTVINETTDPDITFTVVTTGIGSGILYYTILSTQGTVDETDLSKIKDKVVLDNNGTGSFTLSALDDHTEEDIEKFQLQLRATSYTGTIVATSVEITIADTSVPEYRIVVNPAPQAGSEYSIINETDNRTVTFTIYTVGVGNTPLFYTIAGVNGAIITQNDFSVGTISGTITMSNDYGAIAFTTSPDLLLEGNEDFILQLRINDVGGRIVKESNVVRIIDTSVPTYEIRTVPAPDTDTFVHINETTLNQIGFFILTTGVSDGTTLYYKLDGANITADDFDTTLGGSITGTVAITEGRGETMIAMNEDYAIEGSESFIYRLYTDANRTKQVAVSSTVFVHDTSVPTYAVSANITTVSEGGSIIFTITCKGVADGTILSYDMVAVPNGVGGYLRMVDDSDFLYGTSSGTVTILNNTGTVTKYLKADTTTEGPEYFYFRIKSGTVEHARSVAITVLDSSITPFTCSITANSCPSTDAQSQSCTFTVDGLTGTGTVSTRVVNTAGCANPSIDTPTLSVAAGGQYTVTCGMYTSCPRKAYTSFECKGGGDSAALEITVNKHLEY